MRLAEEAVALTPAAFEPLDRAEFLMAQAEVSPWQWCSEEAEARMRHALRFYENPADGPTGQVGRCPARQLTEQHSALKP